MSDAVSYPSEHQSAEEDPEQGRGAEETKLERRGLELHGDERQGDTEDSEVMAVESLTSCGGCGDAAQKPSSEVAD